LRETLPKFEKKLIELEEIFKDKSLDLLKVG